MKIPLVAWRSVLVLVAILGLGCSDPTLEEACAEYCDALVAADCAHPTAKECSAQCDGLRDQLDGKCIEEYTDTYDCAADLDFECRDGNAVATDVGCIEEAFDALECGGFVSSDSSDSSTSEP